MIKQSHWHWLFEVDYISLSLKKIIGKLSPLIFELENAPISHRSAAILHFKVQIVQKGHQVNSSMSGQAKVCNNEGRLYALSLLR